MTTTLKEGLASLAKSLHFPLLGFCSPQVDDFIKEAYEKWLERKQHAGMQWMERNKEVRENPELLLPGVRTIIVVALPYGRNGQERGTEVRTTPPPVPKGEPSRAISQSLFRGSDAFFSETRIDNEIESGRRRGERHQAALFGEGRRHFLTNGHEINNEPEKPLRSWGTIAKYAQSRDYHYIFKSKMKKFMRGAENIFQEAGITDAQMIASCDTKPILERYFAWKAGLGFIGKNSLLITKEFGSYVLLGCFLTTVKIDYDEPGQGTCGQCTRCLDACPTKAIVSPRTIDGSKCIAYWTIEHRGEFPEQAPPLAGRLFGCDLCQDVCPYNKVVLRRGELPVEENKLEQEWRPSQSQPNQLLQIRVPEEILPEEILSLSPEEFTQRYQGTPLMRAGYEGMKRNARKVKGEDASSY